MNLEQSKTELEQVRQQLSVLRARGSTLDSHDVSVLEQKEAELVAQIDAAQKQEVITDVQTSDTSYTLTVGNEVVDFRANALNEESYQYLAIAVRLKLQEAEQQHVAEIAALKNSYEADTAHNDQVISTLKDQLHQAENDRDDFRSKWEAATNELASVNAEVTPIKSQNDALQKQVDDLRKQIEKPAQTNLDISAFLEAKRKSEAAKPVIYDVQQADTLGKRITAKLAKTGETIEFGFLDKGKYREVTAEEALTFRNQPEAEQAQVEPVPQADTSNITLVTAPPLDTFQDTGTQHGSDANAHGQDVAHDSQTGTGTLEERVAALEKVVYGQVKAAA